MTETLPLHLFGPLQAWGMAGAAELRTTDRFPTKSGVIGMMASALGRVRGSDSSDLAALKYAMRLDRRGTLTLDFHSVSKPDPKAAAKAASDMFFIPRSGVSGLTKREYLVWYGFTVFVEGGPILHTIREALLAPHWDISLGRRNCHPAVPVVQTDVLDMDTDTALESYWPSYTDHGSSHQVMRDARPGEPWMLREDEPLIGRRHSVRTVTYVVV